MEKTKFESKHTKELEGWIDHLDSNCEKINYFILPGGGIPASYIHICIRFSLILGRSVCRRCERDLVPLMKEEQIDPEVPNIF